MSVKHKMKAIAAETLDILECGEYFYQPANTNVDYSTSQSTSLSESQAVGSKDDQYLQRRISIADGLKSSCEGTILTNADAMHQWNQKKMNTSIKSTARSSNRGHDEAASSQDCPTIKVVNQTTFTAAKDVLMDSDTTSNSSICCLNFASAKNPGGGFLNGSQAQEEALARASGLYASLQTTPEYYEINRQRAKRNGGLYEDMLIYSPNVPVFRNDKDELIDDPWETSIITMPAPNRGVLLSRKGIKEKRRNELEELVVATFKRRIRMILTTAVEYGHRHLVLGAWGCGVFKNDPVCVSKLFREALLNPRFAGKFDSVVFAVLCNRRNMDIFNAFESTFKDFSARVE